MQLFVESSKESTLSSIMCNNLALTSCGAHSVTTVMTIRKDVMNLRGGLRRTSLTEDHRGALTVDQGRTTMPPLTQFAGFQNLPKELRLRVWLYASAEPRIIEVNKSLAAPSLTPHVVWGISRKSCPIPSGLLSTNREARNEYLYLLHSFKIECSSTFTSPKYQPTIYFNPVDTLYLAGRVCDPVREIEDYTCGLDSILKPNVLDSVRVLGLDSFVVARNRFLGFLRQNSGLAAINLNCTILRNFKNLEVVRIVIGDDDASSTGRITFLDHDSPRCVHRLGGQYVQDMKKKITEQLMIEMLQEKEKYSDWVMPLIEVVQIERGA